MNTLLTKTFDNIGFDFSINNNHIIPSNTIGSFNTLNSSHVGYYIPYLARNSKEGLYETGIGQVKYDSTGNIIVERVKIAQSSTGSFIEFPSSNNEFYIFANKSIFDNTQYNTVILDRDTKLESVSALYIIDATNSDITITLPPLVSLNNPILEFKALCSDHHVAVRTHADNVLCILSSENSYVRIGSDNTSWIVLNEASAINPGIQSVDNSFNMLSDPQGSAYSLQYKINGTTFGGTNSYWDPTNNSLLLGADNSAGAKTILPSSGDYATVFNNTKNGSDFIVYGSGSYDKNLFFTYDGRIGVNIPSGSRPSTLFHIVNTVCQEGLRLENRTSCHPANITLYHKPSTDITAGSTVSQIKLSAKNSAGNQINYAKIESRAINTSANSEKGSFDVIVVSGVTGIKTIDSNTDYTSVGYSDNRLQITNNGNILLSNKNAAITVGPQTITLSAPNTSTTGSLSATNIVATTIEANTFKTASITPSSILTIDGSGKLAGTNLVLNNLGSINLPIASNKFLSTTTNGAITGVYSLDDYFRTDKDISWNKLTPRSASVCLKQITFIDTVTVDEFSVGDQIVITTDTGNVYRHVVSLDITNSTIAGLVVDQNVTQNSVSTVTVASITKGGYLEITPYVDDGIVADASLIRLSTQPTVDTVFNENQKDINFSVYGLDEQPALLVKANTGRSLLPSGIYHAFACGRNDMFPIIVNANGSGLSNTYSSANYDYDVSRNLFSGILSDVGTNGSPSFYGTYDQNGNASEWIELPNTVESKDKEEFVAGGSYLTTNDISIGASGLKSIELLTRASGYADVGFRIASLHNLTDSSYVVSNTGLNINFASVTNPKNAPDMSVTYFKQPVNSSPRYIPLVTSNLGSVNNNYRISKNEITNNQYCQFLNAVAHTDDRGLYDSRMSSAVVGGITRVYDAGYVYSAKESMGNKPVVFVNYLSVIRFVNWLHNGAALTVSESEVDYTLDTGAYTIISIGNNSYNIIKSSYRKYWLPDLNEWHKAAYFTPVNALTGQGSSTVNICRSEPQIIGSGVNKLTGQPAQEFANLSVSGWLYVDHLIVGDGTIRSSKQFLNVIDNSTNTTNTQSTITSTSSSNNYDAQWNNLNAIVTQSFVSCVSSSGCYFDAKPLRLDEDTLPLCTDLQLIADNNVPWWCETNNNGPGWFIK